MRPQDASLGSGRSSGTYPTPVINLEGNTMNKKTCPCCGEEHSGKNLLCGFCEDWVDDVTQSLETRWCPDCGSPTDDLECPACGYIFMEDEVTAS